MSEEKADFSNEGCSVLYWVCVHLNCAPPARTPCRKGMCYVRYVMLFMRLLFEQLLVV